MHSWALAASITACNVIQHKAHGRQATAYQQTHTALCSGHTLAYLANQVSRSIVIRKYKRSGHNLKPISFPILLIHSLLFFSFKREINSKRDLLNIWWDYLYIYYVFKRKRKSQSLSVIYVLLTLIQYTNKGVTISTFTTHYNGQTNPH